MRYIDSGMRDPKHALGTWLAELDAAGEIIELRIQTGFFAADGLAPLASTLSRLKDQDGVTRILVGSNDGTTQVTDVKRLVEKLGLPRANGDLGVVSFANAYYHPKVVHVIKADGSIEAYVGSANLTASGVGALHVEVGVIFNSSEGDAKVLIEIMEGVDRWFDEGAPGLYVVNGDVDVDDLAAQSILGVPRPPSSRTTSQKQGGKKSALVSLQPLVVLPSGGGAKGSAKAPGSTTDDQLDAVAAVKPVNVVATWKKKITTSDAQRKRSGNQRGSITLVAAQQGVSTQHFFRDDFFLSAKWQKGVTRTGQPRETALVPMAVSIDGVNLGVLDIPLSHAENREAGQNNYASLLHLGPLSDYFTATDMTGKTITVDRRDDGSFALTIA